MRVVGAERHFEYGDHACACPPVHPPPLDVPKPSRHRALPCVPTAGPDVGSAGAFRARVHHASVAPRSTREHIKIAVCPQPNARSLAHASPSGVSLPVAAHTQPTVGGLCVRIAFSPLARCSSSDPRRASDELSAASEREATSTTRSSHRGASKWRTRWKLLDYTRASSRPWQPTASTTATRCEPLKSKRGRDAAFARVASVLPRGRALAHASRTAANARSVRTSPSLGARPPRSNLACSSIASTS